MEKLSIIKRIGLFIATLFGGALLCYLLMVIVYCIPVDGNIKEHVKESCDYFKVEDNTHDYMEHRNSETDIYSDAIYLAIAAEPLCGNPFIDAVKCKFNSPSKGAKTEEDLMRQYDPENFDIPDYPYVEDFEYIYGRYWHGYQTYLKPLLFFFNYGTIRTIMMFVFNLLFVLLLIATYKRNKLLCIPEFLFFVFLNPVTICLCFQYFIIGSLTLIVMIIAVCNQKWLLKSNVNLTGLFMIFGMFTCYVDIMTFPFLCLTMPLILVLVMSNKKLKKTLVSLVLAVFFGSLGYFFMMGLKLLILGITCGSGVLFMSLMKAGAGFDNNNSIATILYNTFFEGTQPLITFSSFVIVIFTIYLMFLNKKLYLEKLIPLLIIACAPIVVIITLKYHTLFHLKFVYREIAMTYFAIECYCMYYYKRFCEEKNLKTLLDCLNYKPPKKKK